MTIRVLLFAVLRDVAGAGEVWLEVGEKATARSAGVLLGERFGEVRPYLPRVGYAINQRYEPADTELHEGDELALIPPVSGG